MSNNLDKNLDSYFAKIYDADLENEIWFENLRARDQEKTQHEREMDFELYQYVIKNDFGNVVNMIDNGATGQSRRNIKSCNIRLRRIFKTFPTKDNF